MIPKNHPIRRLDDVDQPVVSLSSSSRGKPAVRRRRFLQLVLAVAFLASLPFLVRWVHYRNNHVVTHEAFVNGIVTEIGARFDGQVKLVATERNRRVHQGDVLLRLEDGHLLAKVEKARAEMERARRELEVEKQAIVQDRRLLSAGVEQAQLESEIARAEVQKSASEMERWKRNQERIAKLHADGLESQAFFEEASAKRAAATAEWQADQARRRHADGGRHYTELELEALSVRESKLQVMGANVEAERADLAAALSEADAALIRAPSDGWVVDLMVGPGTSVRVGQPMLSFWSKDQVWVDAWVNQDDLSKIAMGSPADVTLEAYSNAHLQGRVEGVWAGIEDERERNEENAKTSPLLARNSKIKVRIALPNVDAQLIPGLAAIVGIERGSPELSPAGGTLRASVP
jgi:membrane fusion protein, multidrug efflux system